MRVVLDTNIFLSALLVEHGVPAQVVEYWRAGCFDLITSLDQIEEIKRAARHEKVRLYVSRTAIGRLVNSVGAAEIVLSRLPRIGASSDPDDDYVLAMAVAADADFLVTGDQPLLTLGRISVTSIVSPCRFATMLAGRRLGRRR